MMLDSVEIFDQCKAEGQIFDLCSLCWCELLCRDDGNRYGGTGTCSSKEREEREGEEVGKRRQGHCCCGRGCCTWVGGGGGVGVGVGQVLVLV